MYGRVSELTGLQNIYESESSTLTVLYGRTGIGKTTLLKEFMKDKSFFYYSSVPASKKQQEELFEKAVKTQIGGYSVDDGAGKEHTYREYVALTQRLEGDVKVIIIEEFQNIVKRDSSFMDVIAALVKGEIYDEKVCVILTSSSISWIENSLVSAIGSNARLITEFVKLKELSFVDTVRAFPRYSVPDCMLVYAITGGVPSYMKEFSDTLSVKDNICKAILCEGKKLNVEGGEYIKEELRETSLYNTILSSIAAGANKLNDLHAITGFGRDKISVYLKNLIEREIVDKIFSYDTEGNEYTKKGLYRIKSGFTEFWFKYIYGNESDLKILTVEEYYDKYIADSIDEFAKETFVRVGTEFIELLDSMDKLPIKIDRRGRWWGKNSDIDIIACDNMKNYVIGKCSWLDKTFTYEMYEELIDTVGLAGIGSQYVYLFSKEDFDERLTELANSNSNINLISLNDL